MPNKRRKFQESRCAIVLILFLFFLSTYPQHAIADKSHPFHTNPVHHSVDGKKWRIGYIQGGEYVDYQKTLIATLEGLVQLGWIVPFDVNKLSQLDTRSIWRFLAQDIKSNYLSFVKDAFYTTEWLEDQRADISKELKERIGLKKDIDLVIAMGTWAGQDMSKLSIHTNVLVMSSSEPILAGIIKGADNSGAKNLHAQIDPTFYERQIRFFHDVTQCKRLGIIFEDSEAGKSYAGINTASRLSKELGFEIATCHAISDIPDTARCEREYLSCIDKLAPDIDAIYITLHGGVTENSLPIIAEKLTRHKLLSLSQAGLNEVEKGLLLSLSRSNFKKLGLFEATVIANVFNGASPGELPQVFEEPLSISLNYDTANAVGFFLTADTIAAADFLIVNGITRKVRE